MAVHIIPTPPAGVYRWELRREFEGVFYKLMFRWNLRAGAWFIDFADANGTAQVRGVKMNLGVDKLSAHKYLAVPQGELDVIDSTGTSTEPTLDSFGSEVVLQYTDDDSVLVVPDPVEIFPG